MKNENNLALDSNFEEERLEKYLKLIDKLDSELLKYFENKIRRGTQFNRRLVSFQANKSKLKYRWYKYKEAFSTDLVNHFIEKYQINNNIVFDPFAGSGTTLFSAVENGLNAEGIELLPIGHKIIEVGYATRHLITEQDIKILQSFMIEKSWDKKGKKKSLNELRITEGAYSNITVEKISRYLFDIDSYSEKISEILLFALLCVLESISYTRKDGQYLRWDYRSGRSYGKKKFDKGQILDFNAAITDKLKEIINDSLNSNSVNDLFQRSIQTQKLGKLDLYKGSCLKILPTIKARRFSLIFTSPPYCNRYDYTRTYALEHALLGIGEKELISLRQEMLSCTVENKRKVLMDSNKKWQGAIQVCNEIELLIEINNYLSFMKSLQRLNNNGIARMVKNYFYELACVIQECYRALKKDGLMIMVNDNVKFAGASISVDLILSKIAEEIGFYIEEINVLPQVKGNSSQQMGKHGREGLRKCIYVWRKIN